MTNLYFFNEVKNAQWFMFKEFGENMYIATSPVIIFYFLLSTFVYVR